MRLDLGDLARRLRRRKHFSPDHAQGAGKLQRTLSVIDVTAVGLGQIIGAGIFVLAGVAAKKYAGPGVILSFVASGTACIFSALCYAEFASRSPTTGSAYGRINSVDHWVGPYAGGGERAKTRSKGIQYAVAAATVARGWSGYAVAFFAGFGVTVPEGYYYYYYYHPSSAVLILLITLILCLGAKDSTRFNLILVILTILIIFGIIGVGTMHWNFDNWKPFLPKGVPGIFAGASVIFFAYVGFDTATTMAEEMKNPRRDLPIAVISSLVISILLYVSVAATMTLMVPTMEINEDSPLASAFAQKGQPWMEVIISVGASAALITTCFNSILGMSRIYYAMARDGLLFPIFARFQLWSKTGAPVISTLITGSFAIFCALVFDIEMLADMVSIGTLLAFTIVCASVLKLRYDEPVNTVHRLTVLHFPSHWNLYHERLAAWSYSGSTHSRIESNSLSIFFAVIMTINVGAFFSLRKISNSKIREDTKIAFVTPLVPIVPIAGMLSNIYLMSNLSDMTWLRLSAFLVQGLSILKILPVSCFFFSSANRDTETHPHSPSQEYAQSDEMEDYPNLDDVAEWNQHNAKKFCENK
ncbi:hypothetical protein PROFUN_12708 [Planoprotostelium fungivorum]|uniref:Cationic amino acid transporter C-terminal domain-containing protein n=1 Tax=Planoprotostelium fungivorum TaxID=1890364 RepID=A0A2P6N6F5_9EUKA|nr:hypothetical protein PROFUN_12708 [Planoprotostelium fungivorum]